jgi:predicted nucleic acid-binding protein
MLESVYLETTFISYLVARPSGDVIVAAHQQTTRDWWNTRRNDFQCNVSQVVIDEASAGDPAEIQKRLDVIRDLRVLEVTVSSQSLAQSIIDSGVMPPRAVRDAAHIAVAAVHGIDYLLTWNCRHLANAQMMRRIEEICTRLSKRMPLICTPEELMGN